MRHTISILVENEFGALARIAGLFSSRGYNIESLSAAPTLDPHISRMTINTSGNDHVIEQIIKQLNKLINIIKVKDVTTDDHLDCALAMIKVNLGKRNREKLKKIISPFHGKIVDVDEKCSLIQIVETEENIHNLVDILQPYGIMEFISTGSLAIQRGKKTIRN
jgi:acetolactate synthase-1/3 small subunit